MSSLFISMLASGCSSVSSLCFRKNNDVLPPSCCPNGYLLFFYTVAFLLCLAFRMELWHTHIDYLFLGMGIMIGVLNTLLMYLIAKTLRIGPSGLTYAFINASAVFAGFTLFAIFGEKHGFSLSLTQLSGMAIVVFGLFLGSKKDKSNDTRKTINYKWIQHILLCIIIQLTILTCTQARCLLFKCNVFGIHTEQSDLWFMPGQFGIAALIQISLYLWKRKKIQRKEIIYGCFGGIANFSSTYLLVLATLSAKSFELSILFPFFAVIAMLLCKIWANIIYRERWHINSCIACSLGILMTVA